MTPPASLSIPARFHPARAAGIADEHSVLLWQTCAYADELIETADSHRRLAPTYDAMLGFLHHRLLPYLVGEESRLGETALRDAHLAHTLLADHDRLRDDVENVEASRTRRLLSLAAAALVERLGRHVQREESWVTDATAHEPARPTDLASWALPLLLDDDIEIDALPAEGRDVLVLERLRRMRPGESVRLHAGHDLHPLWLRHQRGSRGAHAWVYEENGPRRWSVRVTRRHLEGV